MNYITAALVAVLALAGLVAVGGAIASAGVNCQTYGNQTFCNDSNGNSAHCTRYGNQVFCS